MGAPPILTDLQLEAAGYRFERSLGRALDEREARIVRSVELPAEDIAELAQVLVRFLESDPASVESRIRAYWALSKLFDRALLPRFRSWLRRELRRSSDALFQVMIALDNLGEPVFPPERTGVAAFEKARNMRDAARYLDVSETGG